MRQTLATVKTNPKWLTTVTKTETVRIREKTQVTNIEPASLSDVQEWEEKTNDTIMAMEFNVNIIKLLQKFYRDLVRDDDFPSQDKRACQTTVKTYSFVWKGSFMRRKCKS